MRGVLPEQGQLDIVDERYIASMVQKLIGRYIVSDPRLPWEADRSWDAHSCVAGAGTGCGGHGLGNDCWKMAPGRAERGGWGISAADG